MATKTDVRLIVASEDTQALVDKAASVNDQLAGLTQQDKALKSDIVDAVAAQIQKTESSIRVQGRTASAVVVRSESAKVDSNSEHFEFVKEACDVGLLDGILERSREIVTAEKYMGRAVGILKDAGVPVAVKTTYVVSLPKLREAEAAKNSPELAEAVAALKCCVEVNETYRIRFGR